MMHKQGTQTETGHFDVADTSNKVIAGIEFMNAQLQAVGGVLHAIKVATEKHAKKDNRRIVPGDTLQFNYPVMSAYVDNSSSGNPITLTDESGVSFTVAANTQEWIHPLGSHYFDVTGQQSVPGMFVDEFLPIK